MNGKSIRMLIDIGHPAHVHLFRNAINAWRRRGHDIVITIRDKDITARLLDRYGLAYKIVSRPRRGMLGLLIELLEHDWGVLKASLSHKSQLLLGTSVSITHVARIIGAKSIVFNEDDADVAYLFTKLAYPLAHAIVTPECLNEDYGLKHVTYKGYQKLAYLHPNVFTPDPAILKELDVFPGEPYFIIRLVSLNAAHDIGEIGIGLEMLRKLIQFLSTQGRVFITSEKPLLEEFEPYRIRISPVDIHKALAYSTLFIGDSQSMTVEAAMLGIPSIRCNTIAKRSSVLRELEDRYGLTFAYLPKDEDLLFAKVNELLEQKDLGELWRLRKNCMLKDKVDLTRWMVDFVEKFIND
jgi:uncharacterized protein